MVAIALQTQIFTQAYSKPFGKLVSLIEKVVLFHGFSEMMECIESLTLPFSETLHLGCL